MITKKWEGKKEQRRKFPNLELKWKKNSFFFPFFFFPFCFQINTRSCDDIYDNN